MGLDSEHIGEEAGYVNHGELEAEPVLKLIPLVTTCQHLAKASRMGS